MVKNRATREGIWMRGFGNTGVATDCSLSHALENLFDTKM